MRIFLFLFLFGVVKTYSQIPDAYPFNQNEIAEIELLKAKVTDSKLQCKWREASDYLNQIAIQYWNHNFLEEAVIYYEESKQLNERLGNRNGLAMLDNNLGMIYSDLGEYEKAYQCFLNTYAVRKLFKNKEGCIGAAINISQILNHQEEYGESIRFLEEALVSAKELNNPEQLRLCYGVLAETYQKKGDMVNFKRCFELYRSFHEMIVRAEVEVAQKEVIASKQKLEMMKLRDENQKLKIAMQKVEILNQQEKIVRMDSLENELISQMTRKELELELNAKIIENNQLNQIQQEQMLEKQRNRLKILILSFVLMSVVLVIIILLMVRIGRLNKKLVLRQESLKYATQRVKKQNEHLIELNSSRNSLISMIVHDLKAPLNLIISRVKFMPVTDKVAETRELCNRMMNMIEDLLFINKTGNKKVNLKRRGLNILSVVNKVVSNFKYCSYQCNISINNRCKVDADVCVDYELLTRVIENLISNGLKYGKSNGVIEISTKRCEDFIIVEVFNEGSSINSTLQSKIFSLYTTGSMVDRKTLQSSGVGLTFCKQAIDMHDGEIGVYNCDEPLGCVFWFSIPAKNFLSSNDNLSSEVKNELALTERDKEFLNSIVNKLKNTQVFELTKIKTILSNVDIEFSEGVRLWANELTDAMYGIDEERYKWLLNKV